jgi:hypothetical protein
MNFDDHPLVGFRAEGNEHWLGWGYIFADGTLLKLARSKQDAAAGRACVAQCLDLSLLEEMPNSTPAAREFRYLRPLSED